jgi:Fic family protein
MLPTRTSWYLADLGGARGKQELFTRQSPQKLKVLREHALIESAVSSNRIEGVEVDESRVGSLVFGKPTLKDRDEEEIRGYRDALKLIHDTGTRSPISEATILRLHKLSRGEIWDAGIYKEKDVDIIQIYYEALEISSKAWHQGKHDPWPYIIPNVSGRRSGRKNGGAS